jgi:hypothetical protein
MYTGMRKVKEVGTLSMPTRPLSFGRLSLKYVEQDASDSTVLFNDDQRYRIPTMLGS